MALVVEDGTGKTDAESYASVADANAYHTSFGNAAWTGVDAVKETALRNATRYLDLTYGPLWRGDKGSKEQALDWPRTGAEDTSTGWPVDDDEVPACLVKATCELAMAALTEDLMPDVEADESGSVVGEKLVVGPLEISEQFAGGRETSKQYGKAAAFLAGIARGGSTAERA